jgi:hypothetical protein
MKHWEFLPFLCKRHLFPTSATALSTAPAFSGNKTKINFMPGAALLKIQRNCQMVFWKQYNRESCNISCLRDQRGIGCHTWCITECIQQNHGQTLTLVTQYHVLLSLMHFLVLFHHYWHNMVHAESDETNITPKINGWTLRTSAECSPLISPNQTESSATSSTKYHNFYWHWTIYFTLEIKINLFYCDGPNISQDKFFFGRETGEEGGEARWKVIWNIGENQWH